MSDDICKHGWSRRFCEQCSQARIIASLKGPGDKGMLANPPDDLVERARTAAEKVYGTQFFNVEIEAAIAVVLEEAAKVCISVSTDVLTKVGREHEPYMRATAEDCAAAIRALRKD